MGDIPMTAIKDLTSEGVRTNEAKRLIRRHLKKARKFGHTPALICKSGYMELYGCLNKECADTLDCWDTPEICNGALSRRKCCNPSAQPAYKNILTWFRGLFNF